MKKIICFGELLIRYSPALGGKWIQDALMPVYIGGSELNVASALASWNMPVRYGTALPDNYLSRDILATLTKKNIDTSAIYFSGHRIGTFYLPQGADLKSTGVIYDRAYSSFGELKPGMIDWHHVLEGCNWFHFSAINPALNENLAAVCKEALEAASAKGMIISIDLNYRPLLWQYGYPPVSVMPELVRYCQVVMGNIWSVSSLLGIKTDLNESKGKTTDELMDAAVNSMLQLQSQFPQVTDLAYTFRLENSYWAMLQQGKEIHVSRHHIFSDAVDKAGSGDCFMGGLIYGLQKKLPASETVNFAASAAVGKLQEKGDTTSQSVEQVKARYI
jgi:2-dehydro-3-deoxygluconokinase